jgi:hypothetical protein
LLSITLFSQKTRVFPDTITYLGSPIAEIDLINDKLFLSGNTNNGIDITAINSFRSSIIANNGYFGEYNFENAWEGGRYYSATTTHENFMFDFGSDNSIFIGGLVRGESETLNAFDDSYGGSSADGYVSKLDSDYNLEWATYIGGDNLDYITDIVVDSENNVIVTGVTFGSAAGISNNGFQNTYNGSREGFIAKYDSNGNQLWASYYGGTDQDQLEGLVIDENDNIYACGVSRSTNTANVIAENGYQNTKNANFDGILIKFDKNGNRVWGTYYGGNGVDQFWDIKLIEDKLFLSGQTSSTDVIGENGFDNSKGGGFWDSFLAEFDTDGNLHWSSFLGGNGNDRIFSIAVDEVGNLYGLGRTESTSNLISGNAFQGTYAGGSTDMFICKINQSAELEYISYFGGNGDENASVTSINEIILKNNKLYFTFDTNSDGLATSNAYKSDGSTVLASLDFEYQNN